MRQCLNINFGRGTSSSLNLGNMPIQTLDTHKDLGVTVNTCIISFYISSHHYTSQHVVKLRLHAQAMYMVVCLCVCVCVCAGAWLDTKERGFQI